MTQGFSPGDPFSAAASWKNGLSRAYSCKTRIFRAKRRPRKGLIYDERDFPGRFTSRSWGQSVWPQDKFTKRRDSHGPAHL